MRVVALGIKAAEEFLANHGRHYKTPSMPICAIGVGDDQGLHGAAILGTNGTDGELAHIYCDGASQAYTILYGACWRALKALGYERTVL